MFVKCFFISNMFSLIRYAVIALTFSKPLKTVLG